MPLKHLKGGVNAKPREDRIEAVRLNQSRFMDFMTDELLNTACLAVEQYEGLEPDLLCLLDGGEPDSLRREGQGSVIRLSV